MGWAPTRVSPLPPFRTSVPVGPCQSAQTRLSETRQDGPVDLGSRPCSLTLKPFYLVHSGDSELRRSIKCTGLPLSELQVEAIRSELQASCCCNKWPLSRMTRPLAPSFRLGAVAGLVAQHCAAPGLVDPQQVTWLITHTLHGTANMPLH